MNRPHLNAEHQMKAFLSEHAHSNVPHEVLLEQGPVWETLSELIQRDGIDLMILGTHGRGGLSKVILGSVAEQIFRLAPCPVLIVGPAVPSDRTGRKGFRRILFATDFGVASLHALPYAIAFASDSEARLMLLHVVAPVPVLDVGPYWYAGTNITDVVSQQREARANTIEKLKQLIPDGAHLGSEPEFMVDFDYVPDSILKIAGDAEADLLVMGVNQSAWARVSAHLPWATAHEVLRRAKCPVLTVRS
jgi:nucleotide-binding universal stress UspA family protein